MLGNKEAMATIAVNDIHRAARFYEQIVGLKPLPGDEESARSYQSGKSQVLVYQSEFAGTNRATAATWSVGKDIEQIVRSLKEKHVTFEHYNLPGMTREGDLHIAGKLKVAWFKDPDGNILSIVGE